MRPGPRPRPAASPTAVLLAALLVPAFAVIGWFSSAAATQSDPDFRYTPRDWVFAVLLALATVPYARVRTRPVLAFLAALMATTTVWLLGYNGGALPALILLGAYVVALSSAVRVVIGCAGVALACFALLWAAGGAPYAATEAVGSVLGVATVMALGRAGRLRGDLAEARADAAEEAAARRSVQERLLVAQELHDVLGHSLGTIAVQAGVGRHLMDTDPGAAADALSHISRIARSSLDEVRAAVAAMRDGAPSYRPVPGVAEVPHLVADARLAGLRVELVLPEDLAAISRPTGAAIYRIVREALANVVRHSAGSAVSVDVTHRDGRVELAIRDDGAGGGTGHPPGAGHGVTGMRDRAEALGGSLSAGPSGGAGFLVTASLPVGMAGPVDAAGPVDVVGPGGSG